MKKNDYLFIAFCISLFTTILLPLGLVFLTIPQQNFDSFEWVGEPYIEGSYMKAIELHPTPEEAIGMTILGMIPTAFLYVLVDKEAPFNTVQESKEESNNGN